MRHVIAVLIVGMLLFGCVNPLSKPLKEIEESQSWIFGILNSNTVSNQTFESPQKIKEDREKVLAEWQNSIGVNIENVAKEDYSKEAIIVDLSQTDPTSRSLPIINATVGQEIRANDFRVFVISAFRMKNYTVWTNGSRTDVVPDVWPFHRSEGYEFLFVDVFVQNMGDTTSTTNAFELRRLNRDDSYGSGGPDPFGTGYIISPDRNVSAPFLFAQGNVGYNEYNISKYNAEVGYLRFTIRRDEVKPVFCFNPWSPRFYTLYQFEGGFASEQNAVQTLLKEGYRPAYMCWELDFSRA